MTDLKTSHVDYTQDIATLLRAGTAAAHEKAEHSEAAGWLVRGELDRDEYVRFLMMLYHIYETLETALETHAAHPVLAPIYNPSLFARVPALSSDISHFLQLPSWASHPIHKSLLASPPPAYTAYISRIEHLSREYPEGLLAHSYVRYLGDLSGGQFIKRRIGKAYGLEDGEGVSFYEFGKLGASTAEGAGVGDMKKMKEWYRNGMCEGVGEDVETKKLIVNEANIAFELNTGLFGTLRPPTTRPASDLPVPAMLGDPTSPTVSTSGSMSPTLSPPLTKPSPLQPKHSSPPSMSKVSKKEEGTFPLSSFIAFLIALCVAHFALTVGGFTGERGYAKLEGAFGWVFGTSS